MSAPVSIVIPAYNAERTLGAVLDAIAAQDGRHPEDETIVVDDGSSDGTAALAAERGATVVATVRNGFAGGARNRGWDEARAPTVVFLDSDAVPQPGWRAGLARALEEFPGALIGCARAFDARTAWGWVAHLQVETPYLPRGGPREVPFLSSYCLAVPREVPVRFDPSYGGEDAVFAADVRATGYRLVFDPRFVARHEHQRDTFRELRRQQDRLAYGLARCGPLEAESTPKRIMRRVPVHYFALARLPVIYRRLDEDDELRAQFTRHLPRMAVAEWALGVAAIRYSLRPPALRGQDGAGFR